MRGQKTPLYIFLVSFLAGGLPDYDRHRELTRACVTVHTRIENKVDTFNMKALKKQPILTGDPQTGTPLDQSIGVVPGSVDRTY